MHYYVVVDCAKVVGYPGRLKIVGRLVNLFAGKVGQGLEDNAPHLLELDSAENMCVNFLQLQFRKMKGDIHSHWDINPVIFIRSKQDFDRVYQHLQQFTHLQDKKTGKTYFFRFYTPKVLTAYLSSLSHYPAHLASIFGVEEGVPVIDAFAARLDNQFFTFRLRPLPADTVPAMIELGELEQTIMAQLTWQRQKTKLIQYAQEYFPEVSSFLITKWLEEGRNKQIADVMDGYWTYLSGRVIAEDNGWDYFALLAEWQQKTGYTGLNLTDSLMNNLITMDETYE